MFHFQLASPTIAIGLSRKYELEALDGINKYSGLCT